ncbi:nicotinamide riboside transporter PnuC [Enterococcus sp. CSURQ0835]|uniref:nicotinamide riboside transporter PnuC n=1 Tax=Enterococcus sp. CSURQ0835 TaxID=2681394 RepID=UPI00135B5965|nr:nicotinamide riboside transporter PnuC [Enterococcus sp. CSURQ0835]
MQTLKNYFNTWTKFELSWLVCSNVIMLGVGIVTRDPILALISGSAGVISVVLCAKGRVSNYVFATLNSVLYAYICYQNHLFGGMTLHLLYYIPMNVIGFIAWNKRKDAQGDVKALRLSKKGFTMVVAGLLIGTLGYTFFLQAIGGKLSLLDAYIAINTIIATYLTVSRYAEQWVLWLAGDVVNIIMWSLLIGKSPQAATMLIMWSAYLINSSYGLYNWIRLNKKQAGESQKIAIEK